MAEIIDIQRRTPPGSCEQIADIGIGETRMHFGNAISALMRYLRSSGTTPEMARNTILRWQKEMMEVVIPAFDAIGKSGKPN